VCYDIAMLTKQKKANIMKKTAMHEGDTGSAAVQIGLLSKRIDELASHLKKNRKDNHSRRGLLQMVADRRSHLKYLKKHDKEAYDKVVAELGLKASE
jgi:small subunit ribosomal protein S15